jgi:hypothetical protein
VVTPVGTVQLIVVEAAVNLTTQSPLARRSAVTPVVTSTVWLQADGFVPVAVILAATDCSVLTKLKTLKIRTKIETLAVIRFLTFVF